MKAQGMGGQKKEAPNKQADVSSEQAAPLPNKEAGIPKHDASKIMTVVAVIGVAGLLVFSFSRKS